MSTTRFSKNYCLPCLCFLIFGLCVTAVVFRGVRGVEDHGARDSFDTAAEQRAAALETSIDLSIHDLISIRSQFDTSAAVTRESFARFTAPLLQHNGAVQAFEWIPKVSASERNQFVVEARGDGFPNFDFTERLHEGAPTIAANRNLYFPVFFVEPYAGNEKAMGFDLASNPARREALQTAEQSMAPTTSGRVMLVQEAGNEYGVLVFVPVFRDDKAIAGHEDHMDALRGFVLGVFRMRDIVERSSPALPESRGLGIAIFDQDAPAAERLLYPFSADFNDAAQIPAKFRNLESIEIGGRHWEIVIYSLPSAYKVSHWGSWSALAGGILVTLIGMGYLRMAMGRWMAVNETVAQRTAELTTLNRELEDSEARYRQLIELSPDAIIVAHDHRIILANRASLQMAGVEDAAELIGAPLVSFVVDSRREIAKTRIDEFFEREHMEVLRQERLRRKNGSVLDVEIAASSFRLHGDIVLLAIIRDITERKRAQAEQARLFLAIEQTSESVVITDDLGTILYVNPALEKASGYRREEVLGKNPRVFKSGVQDAGFYSQMWSTLTAGYTWAGKLINKCKDGSLIEEEVTISPIRGDDGQIVNYVAVKRDVTEETRLRDQLNQAQKMEAVGRLAGGIAHDFNNLLMVISSYAELAQETLLSADPLRKNTREILKATERASDLTRRLLAFSRKQFLTPEVIDLNRVIGETTSMVRRLIGEDIELRFRKGASLWPIKADAAQISQALLNLCVNARDAMPTGGALTIETENASIGSSSPCGDLPPGGYVCITIADTGQGMSKAIQEKLFEPFFTTKERGKGTGLGLSMVYGIVKQSGGFIQVESEPGKGARFLLYFPATSELAKGPATALRSGRVKAARGETILLAEDEDSIRELLHAYLEECGYQVLVASDGEQALALAKQHGSEIDLVLTDVIMPHMSGPELGRSLRPYCNARVLFMSGYTDDAIARHGDLHHGTELIQKPISLSELTRRVDEILAIEKA